MDIADGPEAVLDVGRRALRRAAGEGGPDRRPTSAASASACPARSRSRRGRPVNPPIMPGWDGFSIPALVRRPLRRAGARRQRRQHHGPRRALVALARHRPPAVRQGRHRASAAASSPAAASTAAPRARPATSATSASPGHEDVVCRCGNVGCLEAVAGGRALAAAARRGRTGRAPTAATWSRLVRAGEPLAVRMVREAGRALGEVLAGCVNFFNPGVIVIGGDLGEAHEQLLAGVREVIFQRSLPLATRDLRIVPQPARRPRRRRRRRDHGDRARPRPGRGRPRPAGRRRGLIARRQVAPANERKPARQYVVSGSFSLTIGRLLLA